MKVLNPADVAYPSTSASEARIFPNKPNTKHSLREPFRLPVMESALTRLSCKDPRSTFAVPFSNGLKGDERYDLLGPTLTLLYSQAKVDNLLMMDAFQSTQAPLTRSFRCDECRKSFSREHELTRHQSEAKAHQSALQCLFPGCPKAYQRHLRTKEHFWDAHSSELGSVNVSVSTKSTNNVPAVSSLEQQTNRQRLESQAAGAQLLPGSPYPSAFFGTGPQHPLMSNSTNLQPNTTYAPYHVPYQQMQPPYLPQGQQGCSVISSSQSGMSATPSSPSFTSPTLPYSNIIFHPMALLPASQYPIATGIPSSYDVRPPISGVATPNFDPAVGRGISAPVGEGTYEFHFETMDGVEGSGNAQGSGNGNAAQTWGRW
jgi:hypothetical protein